MERKRIWVRYLIIFLIVALFLGIGFGINGLWNWMDHREHPRPYRETVVECSHTYGVPESLIYAVMKTESDFEPTAQSHAGARGLMQMTEPTFLEMTSDAYFGEHLSFEALYLPEVSIRYGTFYLRYLYDLFDGNWEHAILAYNAGLGRVRSWLNDPRYTDESGNLTYVPFDETRSYLEKVRSAWETYDTLYEPSTQPNV